MKEVLSKRIARYQAAVSLFVALLAVSSLSTTAARAQILHASGSRPSFQVAIIKPSKPDETNSGMRFSDGGRVFITTNATLRDLIQEAYNVKAANQITGASGWMTAAKFDIEAKLEDSQIAQLADKPLGDRVQQARLMLQSLLDDRFALKLSSSERQSSFFSLVQAKGGSKMKPSAPAPADPKITRKGPGQLVAEGVSMNLLADTLARMPELGGEGGFTIGDLVVDETNLTGNYDWTLTWAAESMNQTGDAGAQAANGPSLFTALQEQLGLKLERTKGSVEVLVVNHAEKPSAN